MKSHYFDLPKPRLFAHRGASGVCPENTLAAFQAARAAGLKYLELDVWATVDGQVVTHHDETALRLCGVDRRISDLTLAELQSLDAGFTQSPDGGQSHPFRGRGITIPTLAEVLAACPDALFNIEIKQQTPAIEEATLEVIRQAGKEEAVLLAAESDAIMQRLRPLCGAIPTSLSFGEAAAFFDWLQGGCRGSYRAPGAALQIPETYGETRLVSRESVAAAHALGMEVHVWTVNSRADMERLLALGVDGVMSDFPELLLQIA